MRALLMAALAAATYGLGQPRTDSTARVGTLAAGGTFAQSNSRAGMPIFTAAGVGPGDSTSGTVTVGNTGTLGGWFGLSQADVSGALAARLRLTVRDVTAAPTTIYGGPFAMPAPRALGWFAPGDARRYEFTATFPHGSGDAALMATNASARFVWTAIEGPRGAAVDGGAGPAVAGDRRPPRLRLRIPRVQRVDKRWYLLAHVRCDEPCRLAVRSRLRVGRGRWSSLPALRARATTRRRVALRIRIPRGRRGALGRALRRGRPVMIRLRIEARDGARNTRVLLHTVRLHRALRR